MDQKNQPSVPQQNTPQEPVVPQSNLPQQSSNTNQPANEDTSDPGQGLGIASLITSLIGIWPLGFIFGFIARSKSKSVGKSNGFALAGIIISIISLFFSIVVLGLTVASYKATKNEVKKGAIVEKTAPVESASGIEQSATSKSEAAPQGLCLNNDDLATEVRDNTYSFSDNIFFKPDSTEYEYDSIVSDNIDKLALGYRKFSTRKFNIKVSGMVNNAGNAQAGLDLANSRAQKVVDELVKRGVPANRVYIGEPTDTSNRIAEIRDDSSNRNVSVVFDYCPFDDPNYVPYKN